MRYCKKCVMPDTKPGIKFNDDGVCDACENYDNRKYVNWDERRNELLNILNKFRSKDASNWDCIVPVSGGKDSTYQVLRLLQLGMNPLCVTATTCDLSAIGRQNIENIKALGVDYIEFSTNKAVRWKMNRLALMKVGDISWPEHCGIFTIPVKVAVQYKIPLIVWGENSYNEGGGPAAEDSTFTRSWLDRNLCGLLGLSPHDFVGHEGIEAKHIIPYTYPTDEELRQVGVTAIFLGYYLPWDGYANALLAQANGMTTYSKTVEGSVVNYENLDNHQTGIHDYFKYLKFGFGRASDISSLHVRRERITREDAVAMVRKHDGQFPWTCLGKPLQDILSPLDLAVDEFVSICDQFTNKDIFETDSHGQFIKDKYGCLIKRVPLS
ncbi:N-acetyl sugar amidotransferase [Deltaproteobacteria bacterium OttesenSCG-928-K17]|nr:N-acetyl sugar amidotransferase [Deltaproteobacteria bacterium OttesenSCG-928-K17]